MNHRAHSLALLQQTSLQFNDNYARFPLTLTTRGPPQGRLGRLSRVPSRRFTLRSHSISFLRVHSNYLARKRSEFFAIFRASRRDVGFENFARIWKCFEISKVCILDNTRYKCWLIFHIDHARFYTSRCLLYFCKKYRKKSIFQM